MNIDTVQQLASVLTTLVENCNGDHTNHGYMYSGAITAVLGRIQAEVESPNTEDQVAPL